MSATEWRGKPQRPYKPRDPTVTSAMMSRVRARENSAEITLRKGLWRLGYRYRLQARDLIGRPDLLFPSRRVAVFVDGDYWHGRALREGGEKRLREIVRGSRFDWWRDKLARNIARDDVVTRSLSEQGWKVVRIWESDVIASPARAVERVAKVLRSVDARETRSAANVGRRSVISRQRR